jgi:hypothetical protein
MCKVEQQIKSTAKDKAVAGFAEQAGMDAMTVAKAVVGKGLKPNEQRAIIAQMGGQRKVHELRQAIA